MRRGELDQGDEESERSRLPDSRKHIEADLRIVHLRGYHRVANGTDTQCLVVLIDTGEVHATHTTRKMKNVTSKGDLRSLYFVAYNLEQFIHQPESLPDSILSRNSRYRDGGEQSHEVVRQLPDRDFPGIGLESEVEDDLGRDAVDGAVEQPALDGKGKDRQGEVG